MMQIDIWSDIACPWCYVGKRRFEAALAAYEHADDIEVTWHAFELDPGAPAEREGDYASHLARKYGTSVEQARQAHAGMTAAGAELGLELRFDTIRAGNTFDAHRIVRLGLEHGVQEQVAERLFRAYFSEGELMSDHATLRRLAVEAGLPEDEVVELLAGDRFAEEVRVDESTAQAIGINGVPFFVAGRRFGLSGAQEPDTFLEFLRQARGRAAA